MNLTRQEYLMELGSLANTYAVLKNAGCPASMLTQLEDSMTTLIKKVQ